MSRKLTDRHVYILDEIPYGQTVNLSDIRSQGYDVLYVKACFGNIYNDTGQAVYMQKIGSGYSFSSMDQYIYRQEHLIPVGKEWVVR